MICLGENPPYSMMFKTYENRADYSIQKLHFLPRLPPEEVDHSASLT